MTSITAILSRSTSPPLSQRPCPGARTKLVALPNLSVNSCRSSSKRVCVTAGRARSRGQEDLYEV